MFKGPIKPLSTFIVSLALVTTTGFASADYPIAGTAPFQRPEGAPKIEDVAHDPNWRAHALTGVSEPYAPSLGFLDDQGNWHTPFAMPGMLPPYDIRGWHGSN